MKTIARAVEFAAQQQEKEETKPFGGLFDKGRGQRSFQWPPH